MKQRFMVSELFWEGCNCNMATNEAVNNRKPFYGKIEEKKAPNEPIAFSLMFQINYNAANINMPSKTSKLSVQKTP